MTEAPSESPLVVDARWLQPAQLIKKTVILSAVILAVLLAAFLHPDSMPHNQEAFGAIAIKLGVPLWAVVTAIVGVAWLPLTFAFWHLNRILLRGLSEGETISSFGMVKAVFTVPSRHPDLRVSRLIVLFILWKMFGESESV